MYHFQSWSLLLFGDSYLLRGDAWYVRISSNWLESVFILLWSSCKLLFLLSSSPFKTTLEEDSLSLSSLSLLFSAERESFSVLTTLRSAMSFESLPSVSIKLFILLDASWSSLSYLTTLSLNHCHLSSLALMSSKDENYLSWLSRLSMVCFREAWCSILLCPWFLSICDISLISALTLEMSSFLNLTSNSLIKFFA